MAKERPGIKQGCAEYAHRARRRLFGLVAIPQPRISAEQRRHIQQDPGEATL
jgi:hypothetical protein